MWGGDQKCCISECLMLTLMALFGCRIQAKGESFINAHCTSHLVHLCFFFVLFFQYNGSRPREEWEMWHPTLIAEALFAISNILSSLRLISLFTANSHLGPLQISLGRMLLDILKFLFIYCLVLLAFANGLNQLYFYYETRAIDEPNNCKGIRCERQNNAFST